MYSYITGIVLLISWSTASACGDFPVTSVATQDGTKYGLVIPHTQIQQTSAWSPESGEPPLSFTKAYSLAKSCENRGRVFHFARARTPTRTYT